MADEAGGHPLFIDALVRHAAVRPVAQPPPRLSEALWARIAELDPPARQLLTLAAVAGTPLSPELLGAAAELSAAEIDPALARLRGAHLARVALGTGARAIEPYHDRVREAVLDHVDPELRKGCHRALARALLAADAARDAASDPRGPAAAPPHLPSSTASWGPEVVAVHLHAAGDLEQAARYMVLAADRAAAALAFDRAARLYRQALAVDEGSGRAPGAAGDARDVLARLARALVNACRGAEAGAVYLELARRAAAAGEEIWSSGCTAPSSSCAADRRTRAGACSPACLTSSICAPPRPAREHWGACCGAARGCAAAGSARSPAPAGSPRRRESSCAWRPAG